jgi:hypothetical protein
MLATSGIGPERRFAAMQPYSRYRGKTGLVTDDLDLHLTYTCRRDAKTPCQVSEIRLVCGRHSGVLAGEVSIRVFGADHFVPLAQRAPITYGR